MKNKLMTLENMIFAVFTAVIFMTFGITSSSSVSYKTWAVIIMIVGIIGAITKINDNKLFSAIGISISSYMVVLGASTLYANSGKFAISEYVKYLIGFGVFLMILSVGKKSTKKVLWCLTTIVAITAFLSIEGPSLGVIQPTLEVMRYGTNIAEYAQFHSSRISSIFGNSNVFATMLSTTLFMSMYLLTNAKTKTERYIQAFYIIIMANAVLLTFSMGGTFALVIAVFIYIIFIKKEELIKNFSVIILALIIAGISVTLTISTYINNQISKSPLPILAIIIGSVLFALIYEKFVLKIDQKFSGLAEKIYKNSMIAVVSIFVLAIGFIVVALNYTSSATIYPNINFTRTINLEPGDYTINLDYENSENIGGVIIYGRTLEETILNEKSVIMPMKQVANNARNFDFSVVDGVEQLSIVVTNNSNENSKLSSIEITSNGNHVLDVPLNYVLLPENITTRIQGLSTNYSLITRIEYNKDSLKLFALSPVIGHGLGGFENAVQMVQSYQYETKYAHNHFAQAIVDTGLLGFITYASIIATCVLGIFKIRKTSDIAIPLLGSLVVILVHGSTEISMSSSFFVPIAFTIFALILVNSHEKECFDDKNKYMTFAVSGIISVFLVLLIGNIYGNKLVQGSQITLDTLTKATSLDVYEKNDYMLSYVLATTNVEDAKVQDTSKKYIEKLEKASSNTISRYLAKYYLDTQNKEKAFEQINIYVQRGLHDEEAWNNAFAVYGSFLFSDAQLGFTHLDIDTYLAQMNKLLDLFNETNDKMIGNMELNENSLMLFVELEKIKENNMFK